MLVDVGADLATVTDHVVVSADAVEVMRIREGRARMGLDFFRTSIPAEAGLEATIDMTKGCFLGQESVARVRNLGHPPRVLVHLTAPSAVAPGADVMDPAGETVGTVTSAAAGDRHATALLASVRWSALDGPLLDRTGSVLVRTRRSD